MIELRNIALGYDSQHLLLDNVSTTFTCGTTTALIGRNGTGKSTLLRAIIGSEPLKHGSILINNAVNHTLTIRFICPFKFCFIIIQTILQLPSTKVVICKIGITFVYNRLSILT